MPWQPAPNVVDWDDVDRGAEGGRHHQLVWDHRRRGPDRESSANDREEVATRVSPLTYVRRGLPPVLTVHGDADPIVPYAHGVRLHQALQEAGVPNELVTVPGGGHGGFTDAESERIYTAIRDFLRTHDVLKDTSN